MQTNPQLDLARRFVLYTGQNIFLTGKAGTGKTTFLHQLRESAEKRMVVVAPTGVAAINARGVTIHSFFQLPPGPQIGFERINHEQMRFNKEKINIIRSLDLLVIDEISMVRADLLDAVDVVLRRFRTQSKPFGGVQLLMIGDLQQLPPIVKDDEREMLGGQYETPYFFSSRALRETSFISIELTHVFRQQDDRFIALLNKVRANNLDTDALNVLNQRYIPGFSPSDDEGYITLCTHNAQAARINENKLKALTGSPYTFTAQVEGMFPEYSYPTDFELTLKMDAQVMFVKNDTSPEKRFYNGKVGKITSIDDYEIRVLCPGDENEIVVEPQKWDNVKYGIDDATQEIREVVEGSFIQIPLKLAWAITIHKSQGLTFEHAIIDAEAAFAHGQVYVALSRCKTLEGLALSTPIRMQSIISDRTVSDFTQQIKQSPPSEGMLYFAQMAYRREHVEELFRFNILRRRIGYIEKIINDNAGSIPAPVRLLFTGMAQPVQEFIIDVAVRFQTQINRLLSEQPDVEQNVALQDRISKASAYFSDKIKVHILDAIARADTDIDNKTVRKQFNDAINRLESDALMKYESLCACLSGFVLSDYLHARALAAIEKEKPKKQRQAVAAEAITDAHPVLFERLRAWRHEQAQARNVPAYIIFSQKALYELINELPYDKKSLLKINGIGKAKAEQFGDKILEIIREYCDNNKME